VHHIRKSSPDVDASNTEDTVMRKTFDPQPPLGAIPIESLTFDPKSRDDTEVLCYALQALWCDRETRDAVLELIEKSHSDGINCGNGRPGMDFWQIVSSSGVCRDEAGSGHRL